MSESLGHAGAPSAQNEAGPGRGYLDLSASDRTLWILERRAPRPSFDVHLPFSSFVELERSAAGELLPTLTVLLRSRECPWHCLMCDLWKTTVSHPIPPGAIPAQLDRAIADTTPANQEIRPRQVKLYNSGSFFDTAAVPPVDYPAIAQRLQGLERVIVECHPKLVGPRTLQFRDCLAQFSTPVNHPASTLDRATPKPKLEVAMGLETVHPIALERLNKGMTLDDFQRAADFLRTQQIALRAFVLVQPPFVANSEALEWTHRSVAFAFDCGATAVTLIPTRPGNGAVEALMAAGSFSPPKLLLLEQALDQGVALNRGRVFADLWDLERFSDGSSCFQDRRERLDFINREQTTRPSVTCSECGGAR